VSVAFSKPHTHCLLQGTNINQPRPRPRPHAMCGLFPNTPMDLCNVWNARSRWQVKKWLSYLSPGRDEPSCSPFFPRTETRDKLKGNGGTRCPRVVWVSVVGFISIHIGIHLATMSQAISPHYCYCYCRHLRRRSFFLFQSTVSQRDLNT